MQLDTDWLTQQGGDAGLLRAIDAAFPDPRPDRIGIAVSGGGDSVALLHLFARWSVQTGHPVAAVTVDHGLRPESRVEAEDVAQVCQRLGIPHDILRWHHKGGAANLPAAARDGRYALMASWARENGIGGIALGHTADDGAENFIMRLARAAGLDGLASMDTSFLRGGVRWVRPLWQHGRGTLREYLRRHGTVWAEDPSNDDPRYARTNARRTLHALAPLGIDAGTLVHSAGALRQARDALAHYTRLEARTHVTQEAGDVLFPQHFNPAIPEDIERRLVAAALQWVGSAPYPPRKIGTGFLQTATAQQQRVTVAGCLILKRKGQFRVTREYNAVKDVCGPTDHVWDGRWKLDGPHVAGLEVRALGEGVRLLPDWRKTGVPRPTLLASPAVWQGSTLVAAPLAGYNPVWTAQIVADFTSFLLSH